MKEVTTILTIQLTDITKLTEKETKMWLENGDLIIKLGMERLKKMAGFDDVLVLDRKDFVLDIEG